MIRKILLAEDALDLADAVVENFINEAFEIDHAINGSKALEMLIEGDYDLLILDINMPKLNGFEVVDALKQLDYDMPIIALTAKDGMNDKLKGFELGFDDYVTKPFDMRELTARVNAVLKREKINGEKTLCIDDLMIDPTRRSVVRKGEELPLTKIEFDLLLLLAQKAPAVVENSEIIDSLWGDEEILDPPVRSHIKNLRKKLHDEDFTTIMTVAGVGYKMNESEEC